MKQTELTIKGTNMKQSELFKLLNGVNVNDYLEEKQGLSYLKWMEAFRILQNYVDEVNYKVIETDEGFQYWDTPLGLVVKTEVSVIYKGDEITKTFSLPVLDFKNNQMFSNPGKMIKFNKEIDKPIATLFDINTTIQRCYVKTIAMLGLGSYVYSGFKKPETDCEVSAKVIDKETLEKERIKQKNKELWTKFNSILKEKDVNLDEFLEYKSIKKTEKDKLIKMVVLFLDNIEDEIKNFKGDK